MIIEVENLEKHYGTIRAVDSISFYVKGGEIFGILGPNGAGKTTTLECMEGLKRYNRGNIRMFGKRVAIGELFLKKRIGIQLQQSSIPPKMKVWEAMDLFSSFYEKRADLTVLLRKMDLIDKENSYFSSLSGGQKQRLFIALALINDPEILFLDEITTGLDPQARREMWKTMKKIRDDGRTIVMSTHYMEEAEFLCDRVMIMDKGKIVAMGSPKELTDKTEIKNRVIIESQVVAPSLFKNLESVFSITSKKGKIEIKGKNRTLLYDVVKILNEKNLNVDIQYRKSNLEDIYLYLTSTRNGRGDDSDN